MPEPQHNNPPINATKGIPLYDIIDCIENKGLSLTDTGKLLGTHKSNVSRRLKAAGYRPKYLQHYKDHRADILASYQQIILNSINPEDLKKAGLSQKMMAYGVLYDKERLERGQSTENIAYQDTLKAQQIVQDKIKSFNDKYGIEPEVNT